MLSEGVTKSCCIPCVHIGVVVTENMLEAKPEFEEIIEEYESQSVCSWSVTNFPADPIQDQSKTWYITPIFEILVLHDLRITLQKLIGTHLHKLSNPMCPTTYYDRIRVDAILRDNG